MEIESQTLNSKIHISYARVKTYDKIMILLHGYREHFQMLSVNIPLWEMARRLNAVIAVPDLDDEYYLDKPEKDYSGFISEELPAFLREKFPGKGEGISGPLPMLLGGVSMGGYGALLIGMNHPECFDAICCISGAFIAGDVAIGNPEVVGNTEETYEFFRRVFGPIDTLETDPKRNPAAAIKAAGNADKYPIIYLSCGQKDLLYERNQMISALLEQKGIKHMFRTLSGVHQAICFTNGFRFFTQYVKENQNRIGKR